MSLSPESTEKELEHLNNHIDRNTRDIEANTEFRLKAQGVIDVLKFVGFANLVATIALLAVFFTDKI